MGRQMFAQESVFREAVRQTDDLIRQQGLPEILPHFEGTAPKDFLQEDTRSFLVTAALQLAFTDLWQSKGVFPAAVAGQSVGEAVALYAADAIGKADVVRIAAAMARLPLLPKAYRLVHVQAGWDHAIFPESPKPFHPTYEAAEGAAIGLCHEDDLEAVGRYLDGKGIGWQLFGDMRFRPLHSSFAVLQVPVFLSGLREVSPKPLACDFYSCALAGKITANQLIPSDYGEKLLTAPVSMHRTTRAALQDGHRSVLTIGTHPFLEQSVQKAAEAAAAPLRCYSSLSAEQAEHPHFLQTLRAWKKSTRSFFSKPAPPAGGTDRFPEFLARLGTRPDMSHTDWLSALRYLRTRGNVHFLPGLSSWMVLDYPQAEAILQDTDSYSNRGYQYFDDSLLGTDPPEHTAIRELMQPHFIPKSFRHLDAFVPQALAELQESVSRQPVFDLAKQVYIPLTFRMNALLLGVSEEDIRMIPGETPGSDPVGIVDFFTKYLQRSKLIGDYEGLSAGLLEMVAREQLSFSRAVGLMKLLWIAGSNTTYALLSHMAYTMLTQPALRDYLWENPNLLPRFTEECLRLFPPAPFAPRVALRETILDGIAVPAGSMVIVNSLAANRDPDIFPDPDVFLLDRPAKRHLSFGHGPHHCIGSQIGRMAANHFAKAFLPLAYRLELDPATPPYFSCNLDFNAAVSMPLRWKPSAADLS